MPPKPSSQAAKDMTVRQYILYALSTTPPKDRPLLLLPAPSTDQVHQLKSQAQGKKDFLDNQIRRVVAGRDNSRIFRLNCKLFKGMILKKPDASFFSLPAELRTIIYECALPRGRVIGNFLGQPTVDSFDSSENDSLPAGPPIPPLLHVCRQIRNEAISIFFSKQAFCFSKTPGILRNQVDRSIPVELKRWLKTIEAGLPYLNAVHVDIKRGTSLADWPDPVEEGFFDIQITVTRQCYSALAARQTKEGERQAIVAIGQLMNCFEGLDWGSASDPSGKQSVVEVRRPGSPKLPKREVARDFGVPYGDEFKDTLAGMWGTP